ncbi:DUF4013 domain-containing protein [Haloprofundus salinisoli]|uniref:DUF4013 domain-containing protein n=1 Tax=Haloprofundus salinisoli TaxID=2876193 RepID=UPI001CCB8EB0|nr:DUF4013 domain-containing protein [Haloprofundus salinisoli]
MFRDALNAPARTADAVQTLFFGGVLSLLALALPLGWLVAVAAVPFLVLAFPFVFLPSLLLRGYYVRTMQAGLEGRDAAPSFVRWGGLVRDGIRTYVVAFVYLLPVVVLWLLVATIAVAVQLRGVAGGVGESLVALSVTLATLVSGLYLPVFAYVFPAALVTYAATERLAAAFSPRTVGRVLVDREYATGWLLASGLLLVVVFFGLPLSLFLVGVVAVFYLQTVAHSVYGRSARATLAAEHDDGRTEPETVRREPEASAAVQVGRSVAYTDGHPGADVPSAGPDETTSGPRERREDTEWTVTDETRK